MHIWLRRPPRRPGYAWLRFVLLLSALAAPGCGTVEPGDIITVAIEAPPGNLDPRVGTDATSERLTQLIFNSLVRKDESSRIVPDLATTWEIPDPTTYVFRLRNDARFHSGQPVGAEDVAYTFRSILDGTIPTPKAGTYRLIESVEVVDGLTVRFHLTEPFGPFLSNLAVGAVGIVPRDPTLELSAHPVGSGPFTFVHYIPDGEILLAVNPDYFGPVPKVSGVRFKIVPEALVRALELRKGTVDIALNVLPPDMVETLRGEPNLEVSVEDGTNYQYLAFNLSDPIFQDIRVRRAIAYAVNREEIIHYLWRDQARLADSVLPPSNWAHSDEVSHYPYDPELARALLRETGQGDLRVTYRTSTDETGRLVASVLQHQLAQVGIDMEIRSNEFATFYADVNAGNFQMYSLRWIGGNNDPDIFNFIFHSNSLPPNGANRGHYSNPAVDAWIDAARRETDLEVRRNYYRYVQQTVSADLPYVSLWYPDNVAVYNRRIRGMTLDPAGAYGFLNTIWVEDDPN